MCARVLLWLRWARLTRLLVLLQVKLGGLGGWCHCWFLSFARRGAFSPRLARFLATVFGRLGFYGNILVWDEPL